jgi:hypothetical protein
MWHQITTITARIAPYFVAYWIYFTVVALLWLYHEFKSLDVGPLFRIMQYIAIAPIMAIVIIITVPLGLLLEFINIVIGENK